MRSDEPGFRFTASRALRAAPLVNVTKT